MTKLIVEMEMPSCCHDCPFEADQWDYPICRVTGRSEGYRFDARNNRMVDCPIICALPEGHGRLVDADANFLGVIHLSSGGFVNCNTTIAERLGEEDMRSVKVIVPAEAERGETK